jgi:hypothetical protein
MVHQTATEEIMTAIDTEAGKKTIPIEVPSAA